MAKDLKIDPEFAALCPPLAPEERSLLEAGIAKDGCLEPLSTWEREGETVILDGHNRHEICNALDIPFRTRAIEVKDRGDAINWIIAKQLGRRNLTDEQRSYLRGKRQIAERMPDGRRKDPGQNGQGDRSTRHLLAKEYGVGERTITRDANFAAAVDGLSPADRTLVLSGASGLSKQQVMDGKKPGDVPPDIRSAKRSLRAKEKANGSPHKAADIAKQSTAQFEAMPRLKAIQEAINRMALSLSEVLAEAKTLPKAMDRENWTPHHKTRVRADLAAVKADVAKLDKLLK